MGIIPIVLSGGSGSRLWPLSRNSKPKQFLSFDGGSSLIQNTLLRCTHEIFDSKPIAVCSNDHRFLVAEAIQEIGATCEIILEPVARNSCAAVIAGCLQALKRSKNATVLVLAADHDIPDADEFSLAVEHASGDAQNGHIVTFGIKPLKPVTGYGYILPGKKIRQDGSHLVDRFVEKPDFDTAKKYVEEGYLWNSGNFLFRAGVLIAQAKLLVPDILESVLEAFDKAVMDLDFLRLDNQEFSKTRSISIDHAVMEKTTKAAVYPVGYKWSDLGTWNAIWDITDKPDTGNAVIGEAEITDGRNNLVHSQDKLTCLIGVNNTIVVTTRDAVLVASQDHAEEVKQLVLKLQESGHAAAVEALQIFRPWGNYEKLDGGEGYQVKRITVLPGRVLSLQKHRHRAEHWIVVQGKADIEIDGNAQVLKENQSVYVPLGSVHRLSNNADIPLVLIEVQTGSYLGEDDIIRLEDLYNRADEIS